MLAAPAKTAALKAVCHPEASANGGPLTVRRLQDAAHLLSLPLFAKFPLSPMVLNDCRVGYRRKPAPAVPAVGEVTIRSYFKQQQQQRRRRQRQRQQHDGLGCRGHRADVCAGPGCSASAGHDPQRAGAVSAWAGLHGFLGLCGQGTFLGKRRGRGEISGGFWTGAAAGALGAAAAAGAAAAVGRRGR